RNPVVTGHMREAMAFVQRVARANIAVLITGESGTGKEILARSIHDCSDSASKPFVPFNCASAPPHLLESQLFGHRRGAFTSADHDYLGVIRSARDGTLFLDEIGELSLDLQPKLLRKGNIEVAEETMERLILYRWPGNVRQLHNEISRMVALVEPNSVLQPDMISDEIL